MVLLLDAEAKPLATSVEATCFLIESKYNLAQFGLIIKNSFSLSCGNCVEGVRRGDTYLKYCLLNEL